jgi:membrane associated rhomboid family serine protease
MIPPKDDTPSSGRPYVTISLIAAVFAQALGDPESPYPIIGASVAFGAHIGGFLSGLLLAPLLKRRDVKLFGS